MQATAPPSAALVAKIVDFETNLYTAQIYDNSVGNLNTRQIGAGPANLIDQPFFVGINDAFGLTQKRYPFDPNVFTFYEDWLPHSSQQSGRQMPDGHGSPSQPSSTSAEQSVARGERLFNTRQFTISGVAGLNDVVGKTAIKGTCSSCHSNPDIGSNALPLSAEHGHCRWRAAHTGLAPIYAAQQKNGCHWRKRRIPARR